MKYKVEVKHAILEAVKTARDGGKTWPETHQAAKLVGYTGGMESLAQMYRKISKPKRKSKPILRMFHASPHSEVLRSPTLAQAIESEVQKRLSERLREFFKFAKHELGDLDVGQERRAAAV